MINKELPYVVMGLLDSNSIAYAIGQAIEREGGKVIYTVQSERMKRIFFDRSKDLGQKEKDSLDIKFCDILNDQEVMDLFGSIGQVAGVVHSIAFANPNTCLGDEFHTAAYDDLKNAYHISCLSLATVARIAQPYMTNGGSIVALTFESRRAFPYYNWMGVNKAALEAAVRALARRHGRDLIRVNAISAGPIMSKAAKSIPHFAIMARVWRKSSPIPWDPYTDKEEVAGSALFLLGNFSKKITGQTLYVDGGASITAGDLQAFERYDHYDHEDDEDDDNDD